MKTRIAVLMLMLTLCMAAVAQQTATEKPATPPERTSLYKVEYTVFEMHEGKRTNARSYTVMVQERGNRIGQLRLGSKVPITGKGGELIYMDVGARIDVRLRELQDVVELDTNMEITSLAEASTAAVTAAPYIRRMEYAGNSLLQSGKATVLSTMDEVGSGRRVYVEATVTKVR